MEIQIKKGLVNDYVTIGNSGMRFNGINRDVEDAVDKAIEYCKDSKTSSYVIGKHADMLNKGNWQSDFQPKLNKSYNDYKLLYKIGAY